MCWWRYVRPCVSRPLGPAVDGLRRLRDQGGGAGLGALGLSKLCGALRPVFPEWADELPPGLEALEDPKETRHRLLRALTELVERLGVEVLVLEDAHWADSATLEWLLWLGSAVEPALSMVVTYRPTDVPEESLLLGLTSRTSPGLGRLRVALEPLNVEQTRQLVGSMLGATDVSKRFAAFLCEHTDGIPLAVEESVRLLRDRHDVVRHGGQWIRRVLEELEVPPTVRDSVLERVMRLPGPARQVLDAAAVLADPAEEALLTEVAGLDGPNGEDGVAVALASGVLQEARPGRYGFRHALDAQAVADALPASRRRSLHGRAAQALRSVSPEPVVRLARHVREAGDTEAWCTYAEAGADLALETGDDRTAIVTLLEVLTAVRHPIGRRVRLAHKLGDAWFFGTEVLSEFADQVVGVLRDVLASGECGTNEQGELRLLLGRALWSADQARATFDEFEAAVPHLNHRPDLAIRCMVNLALPIVTDWPVAQHLQWLEQAADLAARAGAPAERRAVAETRATVLLLLGEEAGWEPVEVSLDSTTSLGERRSIAAHLLNNDQAALGWGRYADSRRRLTYTDNLVATVESRRLVNLARLVRARLDWYTGEWAGLLAAASELMESEDTENAYRPVARQIVGQLSLAMGARAGADRHLQTVIDETARHDWVDPLFFGAVAALGRLYQAEDAPEDAVRIMTPLMETIAQKGVWLWATDVAPTYVDALIATGQPGRAVDVVEQFVAWLTGRDVPAAVAALLTCRAAVEEARRQPEPAAGLFAQAAEAWAALPRPYDALLAREKHGRCLLAMGDDGGLARLRDVQQRLHDLGASWDADRVAHVLRRHGVEVARAWRRGPQGYGDQLSPRELEVLQLVARGMTNKQIAETLFISHRTVGQHLSKAMRKLEVSSRAALVMAASQAGLLPTEAT